LRAFLVLAAATHRLGACLPPERWGRRAGRSDFATRHFAATLCGFMGSLIKKRRKRMRKKKHKKMLKATRWQRRAGK